MSWWEILGWFLAFSAFTNYCYFRGVKTGIKHSITTLNLNTEQINKLNKELEKSPDKLVLN